MWDILRIRHAAAEKGDLPLENVVRAICRNLRGLGLYVEQKNYRVSFCEIIASSSQKMITIPEGMEASGIALLLAVAYDPPTLVFEEINSLKSGLGRQMVEAVLAGLKEHPGVIDRLKVDDLSPRLSDGRRWWEHIASSHSEFDWVITHDGNLTHFQKGSFAC